ASRSRGASSGGKAPVASRSGIARLPAALGAGWSRLQQPVDRLGETGPFAVGGEAALLPGGGQMVMLAAPPLGRDAPGALQQLPLLQPVQRRVEGPLSRQQLP